jgi:two-component system, NtrC family, nitrogen regulation response regulator GlnG
MNMGIDLEKINDPFFHENAGKVYRVLQDAFDKALFEKLLKLTGGNQLQASRILGINRNTLRAKVKKLAITREL